MNERIIALEAANEILKKAQLEVVVKNYPAWQFLFRVRQRLNEQLETFIAA